MGAYSPRLQHTEAPAADDFPARASSSAPNACRLGRRVRKERGESRESAREREREREKD